MALDELEKEKSAQDSIRPDFLRGTTPISQDEEQAMEREAYNGAAQDIAQRELTGGAAPGTAADQNEISQLGADKQESDKPDNWATNVEPGEGKKRRFSLKKKATISGAVVGLLLGGVFGISVLQGPLEIVHFMYWLDRSQMSSNSEFTNSRSNRFLRRLRYPGNQNAQMRRLGTVLNKYANNIETRWKNAGFHPNWENGILTHFTIDPDVPTRIFTDAGIQLGQTPDGRRTVSFNDILNSGAGKPVMAEISKASGYHKTIAGINTRVMGQRAGFSFKRFSNLKPRPGESALDYTSRVKNNFADYVKSGSRASTIDIRGQDADGDGKPDGDSDDRANRTRSDADGIRNGTIDINQRLGDADGAIGIVCLAQASVEQIPKLQYANVILPLMRQSGAILSMGGQVMAGRGLNMAELGVISRTFFSDTRGSWTTARSMQAEMGKPQTGRDINPMSKPGRDNPFASSWNSVIGAVPGLSATIKGTCAVNNNPVGGAVLSFLGGGVGAVAVDILLEQVLQVMGVDPVSMFANLISGEYVEDNPEGADLGNNASYGGRLLANDQALSIGGAELSDSQEAELDQEVIVTQNYETQQLPLNERLFAITNPRSLLSQLAVSLPNNLAPSNIMATLGSLPANAFRTLSSILPGGVSSVKAAVANNGYDYGFNSYGYAKNERDDPKNDPYVIAEDLDNLITRRTAQEVACAAELGIEPGEEPCNFIPSNVGEFNLAYEECFGTKITEGAGSGVEGFQSLSSVDYFSDDGRPKWCSKGFRDELDLLKHSSQAEAANDLRLWRFYIADTVIGHTMLCYEGEESSCSLFDLGGSQSPTNQIGDSSETCPSGPVGIDKTTEVHNIRVHKCVADALDKMVNAASADGVALTATSAWRDPQDQIRLRRKNCGSSQYDIYQKPSGQCSPPTAIPGSSMHERGLAIDFANCSSRSTACFRWLNDNAARFGFYNFPKEPWHWSTTGK